MSTQFTHTPKLTYPLGLLVALVSAGGLLIPGQYARETANWAVQGYAQDWVDLVLLAPVLLLATFMARRGSRVATLVLGGALAQSLYGFILYTFAVHYNRLFLAYCACLGLSVFGLILWWRETGEDQVASWFDPSRSNRIPAWFLIVTGALFLLMWLSEDLPAVLNNTVPKSLADGGLFTNPVHVLDYSFFLPSFLLAGILLLWKKPLGYLYFPVMLTFSILMGTTVGFLIWYMGVKGVAEPGPMPCVFAAVVGLSIVALCLFFRSMKRT